MIPASICQLMRPVLTSELADAMPSGGEALAPCGDACVGDRVGDAVERAAAHTGEHVSQVEHGQAVRAGHDGGPEGEQHKARDDDAPHADAIHKQARGYLHERVAEEVPAGDGAEFGARCAAEKRAQLGVDRREHHARDPDDHPSAGKDRNGTHPRGHVAVLIWVRAMCAVFHVLLNSVMCCCSIAHDAGGAGDVPRARPRDKPVSPWPHT